jgi:DNA polymerase-3 subunit delta
MELEKLAQTLAKDGTKPIYLIQGEEPWLVEEAVRRVLQAAVPDPNDTMAVTRVDMAEGRRGARDIVAACRAMGLFTSRLAVVVRAAELIDKKAEDREELQRYCTAPVATTTLILKATALDQRTGLAKAIKKNGEILTYPALKPRDAANWIGARFRQLGHGFESDVPGRVADLAGTSLLQLQQVTEQLSLYAGKGASIRSIDVETALAATREHTVFELIDAVAALDTNGILGHLHAMLEQRERPSGILVMVIRHFRQLTIAADVVARGGGADDVQAACKCHPFVAKKLMDQVGRFPPALLRTGFERFMRGDMELKSSKVPPEVLLEQLLLGLADEARRAQRRGVNARSAVGG